MENRIHPDLRKAFAERPALDLTDLEAARNERMTQLAEQLNSVVISDRQIPGSEGEPDVSVRIYEPIEREDAATRDGLPAVLWIHGGGYILGAPVQDDGLCQRFVDEIHCIVVSVDYRLAPEHPFPAGLEDCYAALQWMAGSAQEMGIDKTRIAVAGPSAGGGLTAAVTLLARDRGGPSVCFQMPLYPMIDDRNVTPSSYEITDSRVWNRAANITAWEMYLSNGTSRDDSDEISPYAAPTRAKDLSGLPPAYTCIGDADAFRDETIEYVARLEHAGVPVEFHMYPGCFHGFEKAIPDAPISQRAMAEYVGALRLGLQRPSAR